MNENVSSIVTKTFKWHYLTNLHNITR